MYDSLDKPFARPAPQEFFHTLTACMSDDYTVKYRFCLLTFQHSRQTGNCTNRPQLPPPSALPRRTGRYNSLPEASLTSNVKLVKPFPDGRLTLNKGSDDSPSRTSISGVFVTSIDDDAIFILLTSWSDIIPMLLRTCRAMLSFV